MNTFYASIKLIYYTKLIIFLKRVKYCITSGKVFKYLYIYALVVVVLFINVKSKTRRNFIFIFKCSLTESRAGFEPSTRRVIHGYCRIYSICA